MFCYRDTAFCSAKDCDNKHCDRHQSRIDKDEVKRVGLPVCYNDFWKTCAHYKDNKNVFKEYKK